ncbi:nuclear transport factor 2 family protein [Streptomyces sp. NE06-03E]|uniref:Nuclear transport factor 2 family protein n=1 Tax=Streptomyces sp. gb1(2016) TaxID=1828321 RepID=A0A652KWW8_9ACTN|nr:MULTISPECIES: nuclear transport factor 2 family protein [unclassified Streptomyces]WSS65001.1 nuclear transport factor 2 family protein [Streptomyces sp. NBC_01177]WSS71991.1 nuclear transport factor 2 family protein [Streptomyces sp. NBC_01175]WSS79019.1 nuclear transport factor 2 family protein [Streptomyces sp. NBC_01174]MDX3060143.1 nuclear transport factor 2 family protein [Streptomyces sp. NE06-03E]MDX3428079.1 nuclear transport factor 2 family protein [Streptomyces sp. ME01-18a]
MTEPLPAVDAAVEGELRLLDPVVRASADVLATLLHPDFREIGTSGRLWERDTIIAMLTDPDAPRPDPLVATRMRGDQLAPDLVHLTFDTESNGLRSHRSSLWRLTGSGWRLYFHQATPFIDDPFAEV